MNYTMKALEARPLESDRASLALMFTSLRMETLARRHRPARLLAPVLEPEQVQAPVLVPEQVQVPVQRPRLLPHPEPSSTP
jgi:hypothetical protein